MNAQSTLRAAPRGFTRPYLSVNPKELRNGVEQLIADSAMYFTKALDAGRFTLLTARGAETHEPSVSELGKVFDLIDESTLRVDVHIEVSMWTPHGMFKIIVPDEYVDLIIDFKKRIFTLHISVLGEKVEQIGAILMNGVTLLTVTLPDEHRYLKPFIESFLKDNPESGKNVFLAMRFKDEPPFPAIVEAVRSTCAERGLMVVRADDKEYTDDLWDNVLTYLYGCDYAIAIFDQINYREFNPNVALEVGFLFAQCKRVLLLKDVSIPVMPADIVGKIYRSFNTYQPLETIPPQIRKWLHDYGIGLANAANIAS